MKFVEDDLEFDFKTRHRAIRFDGSSHGLSHCMKAVDFVFEYNGSYVFLEVKDPDNSRASSANREDFLESVKPNVSREISLIWSLVCKFRDSFSYRWAEDKLDKEVLYVVLLCMESMDDAAITVFQDELRRKLPVEKADAWSKPLVKSCSVLTFKRWTASFPDIQLKRI